MVLASCGDQQNLLTLIVFNLIADSRLSEQFTLDEFINLMVSNSIVPTEGKIYEVYNSIYSIKFSDNKIILEQLSALNTQLSTLSIDPGNTDVIYQIGEFLASATHIIDRGDQFELDIAAIV